MSHDPKRPVGKGQHVQVTTNGHYVTSLIADPLAKHFIRQGVLNDYSVGISMPDFRHRDARLDPQGKALRIITGRADGLSRIAELSVVDRGSNFNSRFQIVRKSAGDGDEFVGKMIGDEDEIAKAAPASLTKMARGDVAEKSQAADMSGFQMPDDDLSVTFTPNDLARLVQNKFVEKHYAELAAKATAEADTEKRDIDSATRRRLASEGHALPDGSYPIENTGDLHNAAILARSGHGDAADAKRLIAREARERGVANPLDDGDSKSKGTVTETAEKISNEEEGVGGNVGARAGETGMPAAVKEAEPEVTKDPEPESQGQARQEGQEEAEGRQETPPVAQQALRRRLRRRQGLQRRLRGLQVRHGPPVDRRRGHQRHRVLQVPHHPG